VRGSDAPLKRPTGIAAIEDAVRRRASFNIIHTTTGFKVDAFVRAEEPFESSALQRRLALELPDRPDEPVPLLTAEDVLLFKLRWYRLGQQTQTQQWNDVLGILRVQGSKLDSAYLDSWAAHLGIDDLLQRARAECSS
jgi:hypothetical protein